CAVTFPFSVAFAVVLPPSKSTLVPYTTLFRSPLSGRASRTASGLGDDLDPLELLQVQVAGGRHGVAQRAHEVGGAVGGDRGSEEELLERCDRAHADPVAAGECGVVGLAAPVVAVPRGLLGPGQRRPDHQAVRTAGDG